MKPLLFFVGFALAGAAEVANDLPLLPDPLTTSDGHIFKKARILAVDDDNDRIKVQHDGGISFVPLCELPAATQSALGHAPEAPPPPLPDVKLPDPWTIAKPLQRDGGVEIVPGNGIISFHSPQLVRIEADGIRIRSDGGNAKIPFELLGSELQKKLGGFDAGQAKAFRLKLIADQLAEQKRNEEELAAIKAVQADVAKEQSKRENAMAGQIQSGDISPGARYPFLSSRPPQIKVDAKNLAGGKKLKQSINRDFNKTNTVADSKRTIDINLSTESQQAVRILVEWFFIGRDITSKKEALYSRGQQVATLDRNNPAEILACGETHIEDRIDTTGRSTQGSTTVITGIRVKKGSDFKGWVVRVLDANGLVVGTAASLQNYLHLASEVPLAR